MACISSPAGGNPLNNLNLEIWPRTPSIAQYLCYSYFSDRDIRRRRDRGHLERSGDESGASHSQSDLARRASEAGLAESCDPAGRAPSAAWESATAAMPLLRGGAVVGPPQQFLLCEPHCWHLLPVSSANSRHFHRQSTFWKPSSRSQLSWVSTSSSLFDGSSSSGRQEIAARNW